MHSVELQNLRKTNLIEPDAESLFSSLDADAQAMVARWAEWWQKRIDRSFIAEVSNSEVALRHAVLCRTMFSGWIKPPHLRLVGPTNPQRAQKGA
jgi:chemotaxis regulatin CheY-phosphate phosphatase CheZ